MNGPLYDRIFRRLEAVRWRLADVPFGSIDHARVDETTLEFVRVNALLELSALYATRMFLRDFRDNPDFCQFMSVWYYEEMKHYLVLREYLKQFGREPDAAEFRRLDTELQPAPWAPTLAMHFVGEVRLGMWYKRWAERFPEPVLAGIYANVGADEYRHAACYEEFMEQALARDPALLADFLNAVKFMLFNPELDKHPTTMNMVSADGVSVAGHIPGYELFQGELRQAIGPDDEEHLTARVLKTMTRLSGRPLQRLGDLVRLTRELQQGQPA